MNSEASDRTTSPKAKSWRQALYWQQAQNWQQALKLAISLTLFYAFALTVNWDLPNYGALAIVLVSLATRGATLQKGIARVAGTTIGVVVGLSLLACFCQQRWWMMTAISVYLVIVSYRMQGSRYIYAWFVAGFVPVIVWGDNYPDFNGAFYFSTFRWLETTVGVLIYTLVDCLLWPRRASDDLRDQQRVLWTGMSSMLDRVLDERKAEGSDSEELRAQASGELAAFATSLQQSLYDTPELRLDRRTWHSIYRATEQFLDALVLTVEAARFCRERNAGDRLEKLHPIVASIGQRVDAIHRRLTESATDPVAPAPATETASDRPFEPATFGDVDPLQRAALMSLVEQLERLDDLSRTVLALLGRVGKRDRDVDAETLTTAANQDVPITLSAQSSADAGRWIRAFLPTTAFVLAFLFWIAINPPGAQKVPMMAAVFGLMIVMTDANPIALTLLMCGSLGLLVAPLYWLVMPGLGSGEALLLMVFLYSLCFGYLGTSNPLLKAGPMIMFVNSMGISNQQSFSFQGPVDGGMMTMLAGVAAAIAYVFFRPLKPEQVTLLWMQHFGRGCRRIAESFDSRRDVVTQKHDRQHALRSLIFPAAGKVRAVAGNLAGGSTEIPLNESVTRMCDSLQSTADRLNAFELSIARLQESGDAARQALDALESRVGQSLSALGSAARATGQSAGGRRTAKPPSGMSKNDVTLEADQSDRSAVEPPTVPDELVAALSESETTRIYSALGSAESVVHAADTAVRAIDEVDWATLSEPRF